MSNLGKPYWAAKSSSLPLQAAYRSNLPANSQSGKSIRLKGKGIPAKEAGDLYLNIRINVPPVESEADRAAWEKLAEHFCRENKHKRKDKL